MMTDQHKRPGSRERKLRAIVARILDAADRTTAAARELSQARAELNRLALERGAKR